MQCQLLELLDELLEGIMAQSDETALRAALAACRRLKAPAAAELQSRLALSIYGGPAVEEVLVFAKQKRVVNERSYYILYRQGFEVASSPGGLHIWGWHGAAPPDNEPRWLIGDGSSVGGKTGWWRAISSASEPSGATAWQSYDHEEDEWRDIKTVMFYKGVATLDLHLAEAPT